MPPPSAPEIVPDAAPDADPARTRQIVRQAWQAFASQDAQRIAACFTEDAEWLAPAGNATAVAMQAPSHLVGRDAIVQFLAQDFPRLFVRDVVGRFTALHADGPVAIAEWRLQATLASGRHYDNAYCFVVELRGDRLHRIREYMDTRLGFEQMFGEPARS